MMAVMIRHWLSFFVISAGVFAAAGISRAQPPTQSSLSGAYNVRYLGVNTDPADSPVSFSGTVTFDGNGGFTVSGTGASVSASNHTLAFLTSGQYQVLSNGMIQMTNPFDSSGTTQLNTTPTVLYGGIGSGYVTASSTDTLYSDIFVAVKAGSGGSNATLSGAYRVASLEFLGGDTTQTRDTFFSLTADGKGGLGNVTITGTAQSLNDADTTQTSSGATYTVTADGTGTANFPAPSGVTAANTLLSGSKTLYVSSDGNLFVAGGATGYDMVVGVKAAPGASLGGFYFTSYLENYQAGTDFDGVYSEQGASNMVNAQDELAHQRINQDGFDSYDSTFYEQFNFDANGIEVDSGSYWANGAAGSFVISAGRGSDYYVQVYMKSIPMNLSGNYLNPQGIVNAASSIPFTTSFAPGEFISLYGNGFTTSTLTAGLPFPDSLGGVQVMVNGTPAPIYSVSPTQINAIIPYSAPSDGSLLTIQVTNIANSTLVYSGPTDPGVYTYPTPGGIGVGAMIHNSDGSIVTEANPAQAGEAIQIYCSGLGTVTPTVTTGAAASTTTLSNTDNAVGVYIDGVSANVLFSGLAPGFGGLYQINVTIPAGLTSGDHGLEIATSYSDNYQATIPIK
jgi:uncharacterized protein (TIGR03437 family)